MTNEQIKAEMKQQELLGNKLEVIQLGNDVYMYLNGVTYREVELKEGN